MLYQRTLLRELALSVAAILVVLIAIALVTLFVRLLGDAARGEVANEAVVTYLKRKLEEHHWNVSRAAAEIGLHRQSLQEKLRELGIQRPGK